LGVFGPDEVAATFDPLGALDDVLLVFEPDELEPHAARASAPAVSSALGMSIRRRPRARDVLPIALPRFKVQPTATAASRPDRNDSETCTQVFLA
jgi:hypothetical protein